MGFTSYLLQEAKKLESSAVVPSERYVLAPGHVLGNLPDEGQSPGTIEDRQLSEKCGVGIPGPILVTSFKSSWGKGMHSDPLGSKIVKEKPLSGSLQRRRW